MSKVVYLMGAGASYGKREEPKAGTEDSISEGAPQIIESEIKFFS